MHRWFRPRSDVESPSRSHSDDHAREGSEDPRLTSDERGKKITSAGVSENLFSNFRTPRSDDNSPRGIGLSRMRSTNSLAVLNALWPKMNLHDGHDLSYQQHADSTHTMIIRMHNWRLLSIAARINCDTTELLDIGELSDLKLARLRQLASFL